MLSIGVTLTKLTLVGVTSLEWEVDFVNSATVKIVSILPKPGTSTRVSFPEFLRQGNLPTVPRT